MMKNSYTQQYFIDRVTNMDTRAKKLSTEEILQIMNDGFAEISTIGMFFSDEEVISMVPYYANGEYRLTLDIEEDVTRVYDYYLTNEEQEEDIYYHGIQKMQDTRIRLQSNADVNSMWLDSRYSGRVHIDLSKVSNNVIVDNAIIKYFYVPNSSSSTFYMDSPTRLATESAMGAALYEYLQDTERAGKKRAAMKRQGMAIIPFQEPEDITKPYRAVFLGGGV